MKNKKPLFVAICTAFSLVIFAQPDQNVLMTIAGKDITISEFESIYHKNNTSQSADPKSIDEYLNLFVNFKLKVKEAEELGMDTSQSFKNELAGYRRQLAQPYLTDKDLNEALIKEAYDRYQYDVHAAHILIRMNTDAPAKDTLLAYNKLMAYKKRLESGEDFKKIEKEVKASGDKDLIAEELGYFTAFQMVYQFETAAYTTKPGSVSLPVRTRFGYHIVKVSDKRPAKGQIHTAHIMIKTTPEYSEEQNNQAKSKIDEIYQKLKAGEDFASLAKQFSDDKGSASKGGTLPWFGVGPGSVVQEFADAAFAIKNDGEFSEPVKTPYGWHIIKRLETKGIDTFDEMKNELKNKVSRDGRSSLSKESLLKKIKEEYGYNPDMSKVYEFYKVVDTSYFSGEWNIEKASKLNKKIFALTDTQHGNRTVVYTQKDFAEFINNNKRKQPKVDVKVLVNQLFERFTEEVCLKFEDENLEYKYDEFRMLLQEYRDGILLFELMDKKVWSKAVSDTVGLKEYYEANKQNFMWPERLDASVYTCANADIAKKAKALAKKQQKKGYTDEFILNEINKDSQLNLKIESGKFQKGDNETIDKITWAEGITDDMNTDGKVVFVSVRKKLMPEPKSLKEARGLVTAEYQAALEKSWIKSLQEKYSVNINRELLSKIKQ
jgi:peptidyl-prolyl cis-trans isomerase SurA